MRTYQFLLIAGIVLFVNSCSVSSYVYFDGKWLGTWTEEWHEDGGTLETHDLQIDIVFIEKVMGMGYLYKYQTTISLGGEIYCTQVATGGNQRRLSDWYQELPGSGDILRWTMNIDGDNATGTWEIRDYYESGVTPPEAKSTGSFTAKR